MEHVPAIVLAGGKGERIRHLLPDLPKPMAPAAGRPFIEWVLLHLARQGVQRVFLSAGYKAEVLERHFRDQPMPGVHVTCIAEPRPLGTAGGFRHVVQQTGISPPAWLVLNGDSLMLADLHALLDRLNNSQAQAAILARHMDDAARFGMLEVDTSGRILSFGEKSASAQTAGLINAGVYLLAHDLAPTLPAREPLSFEYDVFPAWLRAGIPIAVVESDAPFLDIGTQETLSQADAFIRNHWDGVN